MVNEFYNGPTWQKKHNITQHLITLDYTKHTLDNTRYTLRSLYKTLVSSVISLGRGLSSFLFYLLCLLSHLLVAVPSAGAGLTPRHRPISCFLLVLFTSLSTIQYKPYDFWYLFLPFCSICHVYNHLLGLIFIWLVSVFSDLSNPLSSTLFLQLVILYGNQIEPRLGSIMVNQRSKIYQIQTNLPF